MFTDIRVQKSIKPRLIAKLFFMKESSGDIWFTNSMKIEESITATVATRIRLVFSLLFFFWELARNLIIALSKPIRLKTDIVPITDISAVATPMFSVVVSLALMTQNKNPKPEITPVAIIR